MTDGRGPDSVIDAVGMEAHGSRVARVARRRWSGLLPDAVAEPLMETAGVDRLAALNQCIETVRRGGTISISGVYGGTADPLPCSRCSTRASRSGWARRTSSAGSTTSCRCSPTADPLGVDDLATHRLPLDEAPHGYEIFQKKQDGAIKVVFEP